MKLYYPFDEFYRDAGGYYYEIEIPVSDYNDFYGTDFEEGDINIDDVAHKDSNFKEYLTDKYYEEAIDSFNEENDTSIKYFYEARKD